MRSIPGSIISKIEMTGRNACLIISRNWSRGFMASKINEGLEDPDNGKSGTMAANNRIRQKAMRK